MSDFDVVAKKNQPIFDIHIIDRISRCKIENK
jgi:hypothetical protein